MNKELNVLGHRVSIMPQQQQPQLGESKIDKLRLEGANNMLRRYKDGKKSVETRVKENERWYRLRHWELITSNDPNHIEPTSAWLFNSLFNKHADSMDQYPEPNILPRGKEDIQEAKRLSDIIPIVMERVNFEKTYSDAWWYKLKHGVAPYGVFWNSESENGLGDIEIVKLDLLNLFWEPGISDIQDSRNLFIVESIDKETLLEAYPQLEGRIDNAVINLEEYISDDSIDKSTKAIVVDWYYKKQQGGKTVVHYVKYVGDVVLYSSEDDPEYSERGFYDHGQYPVFMDVLFPIEGTPIGFGYVDIMREPQLYIDKLNSIILKNAYMAGKKRFFTRYDGSINEEEFADWSKDFVHCEGNLGEDSIREIKVEPLPAFITQMLELKVDELKETSGNRDFSQGSTAGGVTAASAIAALQEAGNKLSRDMIKMSYNCYTQIIYNVIELIRQFYVSDREFRIDQGNGEFEFVDYSNANIQPQPLEPAYPGEEQGYRLPLFDIKIKAQRANPFSRMAQNELAKELYGSGFFNPQMANQAIIALEMMEFEGKDQVLEKVQENGQLQNQMMGMQQTMAKMAEVIRQYSGRDVSPYLNNAAGAVMPGGANQRKGQMV